MSATIYLSSSDRQYDVILQDADPEWSLVNRYQNENGYCCRSKGIVEVGGYLYIVASEFSPGSGAKLAKVSKQTFVLIEQTELSGVNPEDVAWDGSNLWVTDNDNDIIVKMTIAGDIVSTHASPVSNIRGIAWDGGSLWICESSPNKVHQLSSSLNVINTYSVDVGSASRYLNDIEYDGSGFWGVTSAGIGVDHQYNDAVVRFDGSFTIIYNYEGDCLWTPAGLTWDNPYFYVLSPGSRFDGCDDRRIRKLERVQSN